MSRACRRRGRRCAACATRARRRGSCASTHMPCGSSMAPCAATHRSTGACTAVTGRGRPTPPSSQNRHSSWRRPHSKSSTFTATRRRTRRASGALAMDRTTTCSQPGSALRSLPRAASSASPTSGASGCCPPLGCPPSSRLERTRPTSSWTRPTDCQCAGGRLALTAAASTSLVTSCSTWRCPRRSRRPCATWPSTRWPTWAWAWTIFAPPFWRRAAARRQRNAPKRWRRSPRPFAVHGSESPTSGRHSRRSSRRHGSCWTPRSRRRSARRRTSTRQWRRRSFSTPLPHGRPSRGSESFSSAPHRQQRRHPSRTRRTPPSSSLAT